MSLYYNHLTINEREKILFFYSKGYSISKIAKEINKISLLYQESYAVTK